MSPSDVVAAFVDLDDLEPQAIGLDRPTLLLALDQMARSGLSAYDAIYLALALATEAKLATLDGRLAEAAGDAGLLISAGDTGRISEQRTAYRPARDAYGGWAHSAVVGAHIAELRRRALAGF